ncbi:hypothetical protein V8F20_010398 [Naviculisporaceae sp. PSN 640]
MPGSYTRITCLVWLLPSVVAANGKGRLRVEFNGFGHSKCPSLNCPLSPDCQTPPDVPDPKNCFYLTTKNSNKHKPCLNIPQLPDT